MFLVAAATVTGIMFGHLLLALLVALSGYILWHLTHLYRLLQWLQGAKVGYPENASGVWEDIFHYLYRLQKRNRKSKKRLAKMLRRFQQSTNALPDATVVLDSNNIIEVWNDAATRLLGLKYPADSGQPVTNFMRHPDFRQFLEQGNPDGRIQLPSPADENITLMVRVVPYGNNQRLLVLRDITHLRRLEQIRQDFIANVSHELRTPLTVIAGYLEALQDEKDETIRPLLPAINAMQKQSVRMQSIVSDLLLLSRLETEQKNSMEHEVSVPALLTIVCEDAQLLSDGRHHFVIEIDPVLWVRGNRDELHSAFSNLLFNAVRYTPDGGEIQLRWYAHEGDARLEVKDSGIGIAPGHIPRLTERFYRVDVGRSRDTGGTGLGLAIVKHVLLRHGASLSIESELGKGSCFVCTFPRQRVITRDADPAASTAATR